MLSAQDHTSFFELKYRDRVDPWSARTANDADIYGPMMEWLQRARAKYRHALDVGCGEGLFTARLARIAERVTGVDVSQTAIARAQSIAPGNVEFDVMDLIGQDMPESKPDAGFDLIVCSQVLYYYSPEQLGDVLPRLSSMLSADGLLLIANNSTGSRYDLTEMSRLLACDFSVAEAEQLGPHYMILAGRKPAAEVEVKVSESDRAEHQRTAALAYYERTLPRLETIRAALTAYNQRKLDLGVVEIERLLQSREQVRVLDYGCGTGELFTVPLADHYRNDARVEVTAFDVDPASILRLEAHQRRNSLPRLNGVADPTALSEESYDLVCCLEVLEHLDDPQPIVDHLTSLVAPGGLLYVTVPNGYGPSETESHFRHAAVRFASKSDWLLRLALKAKRAVRGRASVGEPAAQVELPLTETLHDTNNVHVQFFTHRRLTRLFAETGVELREWGNTAFLSGLTARVLGKVGVLGRLNNKLANFVPAAVASGWFFLFKKPPGAE